jgi:hypothetical protein
MNADDIQQQMQHYQTLVQRYEALDIKIRDMFPTHDGKTARKNQLPAYRVLARERDELFSEIRALEQNLLPND